MLSMHLRQLTRKPARIVIFILILVLLTAFFCVSLNLYANSMYNLKLADEAYTTIAVMELYADEAVIIGLKTLRLKKCQKHAAF